MPHLPRSADEFLNEFWHELIARIDAQESDNVDQAYPPFGVVLDRAAYDARRATYLGFLMAKRELLFEAYRLWHDDASRELFVKLLLFRALGHERIKLPSNNAAFWEAKRHVEELPSTRSAIANLSGADQLRHFELSIDSYDFRIDCLPANVFFTFMRRQYHLRRSAVEVRPSEGDHVIDAGACFGDTAIDFAHAVGPRGRVHSFEAVATHLQVTRHNIDQNTDLSNVVLHPMALSDRSCHGEVAETGLDPGFSVANKCFAVPRRCIDDLVDTGDIEQVDLIKMDIEGHELSALRGAEQSLRRFRPRLAISLYHRWDDYFRIPIHIDRLCLGYRFYLENYTISDAETVMYCIA
jgi:FkbM family methyltransferase